MCNNLKRLSALQCVTHFQKTKHDCDCKSTCILQVCRVAAEHVEASVEGLQQRDATKATHRAAELIKQPSSSEVVLTTLSVLLHHKHLRKTRYLYIPGKPETQRREDSFIQHVSKDPGREVIMGGSGAALWSWCQSVKAQSHHQL